MPTNRIFGGQRRLGAWLLIAPLLAGMPLAVAAQDAPPPDADRVHRGDVSSRGDLVIDANEVADDVVVYGGTLRVLGRITGDAAVFGGNLVLGEGGEVLGDVMIAGGELLHEGGRVRGEMRIFDDARALTREAETAAATAAAPRAGTRSQIDREIRDAIREARGEHTRRQQRSWFDPIKRGVAGIISVIALALVLAGSAAALVFYGRPYLETVSDTVRASALRAGAVGLAASFLAIPGLIVLVVVLAVSIIGIPLLIAVPLYPLAFVVATAFGFLGVAHAIGERTAEQRRESFDLRYRNSYVYVFTGIVMFFLPWLAAELIGMTPFLGFVSGLIKFFVAVAMATAGCVGLGAVILSRAGTRRTFADHGPPSIDADALFDQEPSLRGSDA